MDLRRIHKIWIYLPVILLVMGLGLFLSEVKRPQRLFTQASGGVVLSFLKDQANLQAGDEFRLDVVLDTKGEQVTHADIYLNYQEDLLEATSVSGAEFFPQVADPGGVGPGAAYVRVANDSPKSGTGIIATLRFKTKKSGSPSIQFTSESLVTNRSLPANQVINLIDKAIGMKFEIK